METKSFRGVLRATVVAGLLVGALLHSARPSRAAASPPQTLRITAAHELEVTGVDGTSLSAVSLRFLPEELEVHQGDTLHFVSEVPLQGIALLPPSVSGTCTEWTMAAAAAGDCDARQWLEDWAFDLRSPWYPVSVDPDEVGGGKVNNAAAFPPFPTCGGPAKDALPQQRPCQFPLTAEQQQAQDTRWGFSRYIGGATPEQVKGVLGSGLAQAVAPRTLDFRVVVNAAPGTTLWAVSLFAKEAHLRIRVVDAESPATTQADADSAAAALVAQDTATAQRLDATYDSVSQSSLTAGVRTWDAYLGVEEGAVALRQSYPKVLEIAKGDRVRWRTDLVRSLVHTVTFPGDRAIDPTKPLFTAQCDLDGDSPPTAGGLSAPQPDIPSALPAPVFCPGGWPQVEFDFSELVGAAIGDGTFTGPGDLDSSGVKGMAPALRLEEGLGMEIVPDQPFVLRFDAASGAEGFAYACALHNALDRKMSGRVVVR